MMKVTYNWLKDFVGIRIPPRKLADKLTMAGLEVTSLQEKEGDCVFEIEITSNRPDWLSVIGIAREVAAITGSKLKAPGNPSGGPRAGSTGKFSLTIADVKDCPLYTAKIINSVKAGPAPDWMRKRLELIGCRSINNIVDITNYVLFERGEPLHAFDLDKLKGEAIIVRRARQGEVLTTIDGVSRQLDPDILVIADKEKPVAVAGIMGGKDTEVNLQTRNILLEAAVFNPAVTRRSRQKLGMQTDSAYRFERGVDLETAEFASWQAARLIREIAGGTLNTVKNSASVGRKKRTVNLEATRVGQALGVEIPAARIKGILNALGFGVKNNPKGRLCVSVPSYRQDVAGEMDLVEEVARVFGYELMPTTLPAIKPQVSVYTSRDAVNRIKDILAGLGSHEVITYSLVSRESLKGLESGNLIEILNPLSREQEIMRPTLLPGLLECVSRNLNQQQECINIFEIAKAFSWSPEGAAREEPVLGVALCGRKSWLLPQGRIDDEMGFLNLKGMLENLFARLGVNDYDFVLESAGRVTVYAAKEKIGVMSQIAKEALANFDIKNKEVFAVEVLLDRLLPLLTLEKKFIGLPAYPGILRDISFLVKEEVSAAEIIKTIRRQANALLSGIKIVDYYKGKQIPPGFKGLTISCLYRSSERTLTEEEISPVHAEISGLLRDRFAAQMR